MDKSKVACFLAHPVFSWFLVPCSLIISCFFAVCRNLNRFVMLCLKEVLQSFGVKNIDSINLSVLDLLYM